MSPTTIKKVALAFSLLSFGILVFGSVLNGARFTTAFIRGGVGALLFGGITWGLGSLVLGEKDGSSREPQDEEKGTHLDKTV